MKNSVKITIDGNVHNIPLFFIVEMVEIIEKKTMVVHIINDKKYTVSYSKSVMDKYLDYIENNGRGDLLNIQSILNSKHDTIKDLNKVIENSVFEATKQSRNTIEDLSYQLKDMTQLMKDFIG